MIANALVYSFGTPSPLDAAKLQTAMEPLVFTECGLSQERSIGFIPPRGEEHGPLVEVINGQTILKIKIESRAVPGAAVKRKLDEKDKEMQQREGRKLGKKEKRELKDEIRLALLPQMVSKETVALIWIDTAKGLMLLGTNSQSVADSVMSLLVKAIDGLVVAHVNTQTSPSAAMAMWLKTKEAPSGFSVDRECELKASDESKAVIRYKNVPLDTDEVEQHVAVGHMPVRLAMSWGDRISFQLTNNLQLKKITFLDSVFKEQSPEKAADNFDADVVIATSELSGMLPDLFEALGGKVPMAEAPAVH